MNPDPLPHQPQPAPLPEPIPLPQPPAPSPGLDPVLSPYRGNGAVARLPKAVRDQINLMLLEGLPYLEIIRRLGDAGSSLKPAHLGEWKKRGYQDWFQQRQWLEHVAAKSEFSSDILATPDTANLHEAGLRLAAAYMLDQLTRLAAFASNTQPETFARLVNALSRLNREALSLQKYRDASARDAQHELKQYEPDRDLTHNDHDLFRKKVEEFFRVKLPKTPTPVPPPDDFLESP